MAKFTGIRIDIETYSSVDINHGAYRYAEALDFEVQLIAYAPYRISDSGRVQMAKPRTLDLYNQKEVDRFARIIVDESFQKRAFNAAFERICLSRWLGLGDSEYLDPVNWWCTAVQANAHGVYGSLDEVARAVRAPINKDPEGRRLIRLFASPDSKTGKGHYPGECWCGADHTKDFARYADYCIQDVMTEAVVGSMLPELEPSIQAEYEADQRINDRGIRHHRKLSEAALAQVAQERDRLMGELRRLTGLDNPNSAKQMMGWLVDQGYPMASIDKAHRTEALADPTVPAHVAEVLTLKGAASLSSVTKHKAALDTRCADGRIRGSLRFHGAHTGREAGRGIQPQNLPRYEAPEADRKRLLRGIAGPDAPTIAKGTVRSSLVPARNHVLVVLDYNAIEARVLGWVAGESWVEAEFRGEGKIYEATASTMFGVDKAALVAELKKCDKCGSCAHCETRDKGKVACIAEGQLVLTDAGLIPIEQVSRNHRVWDGIEWVRHDGVVYLGMKEVITHDGLTATPDHRVWTTAGADTPVAFGDAAARGDRLVESGAGRTALRVSGRYRDGAPVHQAEAPRSVRPGAVRRVLARVLGRVVERAQRDGGLRLVRRANPADSEVVGPQADGGEAAMHESARPGVPVVRRAGNRVPVSVSAGGGAVDAGQPRRTARVADRPGGQRRTLRAGKLADGGASGKPRQPQVHESQRVRPGLLAVRRIHRAAVAVLRSIAGRDHRTSEARGYGQAQGVATDRVTARVYDLLNAGPRHRFTVSGRLVHNCLALGYAGGAGALVTMGAAEAGIDVGNYPELNAEWVALGKPGKFYQWEPERHDYPELLRLRDLFRSASPATVSFWKQCAAAWVNATNGGSVRFGNNNVVAMVRDGKHNRLVLPSGRSIWYRFARSHSDEDRPDRVGRRTFIGKSTGVGHSRVDTHGGKLTENLVQATARDVLFDLIMRIEKRTAEGWPGKIVLHVHDEVVLEVPAQHAESVLAEVAAMMSVAPDWAPGLSLRGEGKIMTRYGK